MNNTIYRDSLTLKLKVDELINYFEAMDKKAKIALAVIKKVCDKFPETQTFINKAYNEEYRKENISVDKVFFMKYIFFFYLSYRLKIFLTKRSRAKI